METKLFEVRDRGTFIPVIAINLGSENESERYLLGRAGYGRTPEDHQRYVLLSNIDGDSHSALTYDPYKHTDGSRTMKEAHTYIKDHWSDLKSGDVVDIEFILKETKVCKKPERLK